MMSGDAASILLEEFLVEKDADPIFNAVFAPPAGLPLPPLGNLAMILSEALSVIHHYSALRRHHFVPGPRVSLAVVP
jgi:hypothetical protein